MATVRSRRVRSMFRQHRISLGIVLCTAVVAPVALAMPTGVAQAQPEVSRRPCAAWCSRAAPLP